MRDFSSRYDSTRAAVSLPRASKWTAHHLPKRLELLLNTVFALPKVSSTIPLSSAASAVLPDEPEIAVRHAIAIFVVSVFPAPLSPEIRIDCAPSPSTSEAYAVAAVFETCGGVSSSTTFVYVEQSSSFLYGLIAMSTPPIAV